MKTIKILKKRNTLKRRKYNGGAALERSGSGSESTSASGSKKGSGKKRLLNLDGHPFEKHNGLAQRILGLILESSLYTRNEKLYSTHINILKNTTTYNMIYLKH